MGTSHSFAELSGKVGKASSGLKSNAPQAVKVGAERAQQVLRSVPGVPHTVAKKSVVVSVRSVNLDGRPGAVVRYTGAAHLVNNPTRGHVVAPRRFVGTRARGTKAIRGAGLMAVFGLQGRANQGGIVLKDGNVRRAVWHPGTKGKHFFQKGKPIASRAAVAAMAKSVTSDFAKSFK